MVQWSKIQPFGGWDPGSNPGRAIKIFIYLKVLCLLGVDCNG